jgi:hypothetical protein
MMSCRAFCDTTEGAMAVQYYVATGGNDGATGDPHAPFATVRRAQQAVRERRREGVLPEAAEIVFRGGRYELDEPVRLTGDDSGSPPRMRSWNIVAGPPRTVTYRAYDGEHPILSGGRTIHGFRPTTVNDVDAWVTRLPEVAEGKWYFTQLWVNGQRSKRPRLPERGLYTIEKPLGTVLWEGDVNEVLFAGQNEFRFSAGDLRAWKNVNDIEFVGLHYWIESRIPFADIDEKTRIARLQWSSRMRLTDDFSRGGAPYYVENVFEVLRTPGQFYLDRPTGELYYIPRDGERIDNTDVVAPLLPQVLLIDGSSDAPVHDVWFRGIEFSHTEWVPGPEAKTATPQAACHLPGAVQVAGAYDVHFELCRFRGLGSYGVEICGGSRDVSVTKSTVSDLGGGGLKVWHSSPESTEPVMPGAGPDWRHSSTCRRIVISDNTISDGGHRFHQAVGVLIGKCTGVQLLHNSIHDFDYSGVSVGWTWGYEEGEAYGNIIEYNHIYNIGRGMLSDMGGIYTLGVQPGTRLRYNLVHDCVSRGYGGWGIYNDEGSSHILIENNVVYRTKSTVYNQHYGCGNIVRNNVFAFGGEQQYSRGRLEGHSSFSFTNNIVSFDTDGELLSGNWTDVKAEIDHNLYFNVSRKPLTFKGASIADWRERGADRHSIVADPLFLSPENGDFRLSEDSPALRIGFRPFDISGAGPRWSTP